MLFGIISANLGCYLEDRRNRTIIESPGGYGRSVSIEDNCPSACFLSKKGYQLAVVEDGYCLCGVINITLEKQPVKCDLDSSSAVVFMFEVSIVEEAEDDGNQEEIWVSIF